MVFGGRGGQARSSQVVEMTTMMMCSSSSTVRHLTHLLGCCQFVNAGIAMTGDGLPVQPIMPAEGNDIWNEST